MSTRAEAFLAKVQRAANPPKPKQPPKRRRDIPVDTAKPGVSATDRKAKVGKTGSRNESQSAGRKGGALLEESATSERSRKSTRGGTTHLKTQSNLQRRAVRATSSPASRAAKAAAKKKK